MAVGLLASRQSQSSSAILGICYGITKRILDPSSTLLGEYRNLASSTALSRNQEIRRNENRLSMTRFRYATMALPAGCLVVALHAGGGNRVGCVAQFNLHPNASRQYSAA